MVGQCIAKTCVGEYEGGYERLYARMWAYHRLSMVILIGNDPPPPPPPP